VATKWALTALFGASLPCADFSPLWLRGPFGARAPNSAVSAHFVAAPRFLALPICPRAEFDAPIVGCERL